MKIQLDHKAMFALFPEGSQAQVELRSAITAAWIKQNIRGIDVGKEMRKEIDNQSALLKAQALNLISTEVGDGWNKKRVLNEDLRAQLQAEIQSIASKELRTMIDEVTAKVIPLIQSYVTHDVNAAVLQKVRAEVTAKMRETLG